LRTAAATRPRVFRLPGVRYLTALSAWHAPWVSNAVTALFQHGAFVFFALIARELGVRRYLLIALALAMTPVIYISSCCTMDYIPALAGQLAASYALLRGRPALAGLLLGISVGCRITAARCAAAVPVAAERARAGAGAAPVPAVRRHAVGEQRAVFAAVWRRYGADFFSFYDNDGLSATRGGLQPGAAAVWGRWAWPLCWPCCVRHLSTIAIPAARWPSSARAVRCCWPQ